MLIHTIKLGKVIGNCYLVEDDGHYILVDTGRKSKLKSLLNQIKVCGCAVKQIELVIMTHGDFDHTGCGAYFQQNHGIAVAMHRSDAKMVESGDMFYGRASVNRIAKWLVNTLFSIKRFTPDILVEDEQSLKAFGIDGKIVHLPGHSPGSIGVLLNDGSLICGDLFENTKEPVINSILDDAEMAAKSVERVKNLRVITHIYPGHGDLFKLSDLVI